MIGILIKKTHVPKGIINLPIEMRSGVFGGNKVHLREAAKLTSETVYYTPNKVGAVSRLNYLRFR